jgi:hypothetical protein
VFKAKMESRSRRTTFLFGGFPVVTWIWEKLTEENQASGCYSTAARLYACFHVGERHRPFLPPSRAWDTQLLPQPRHGRPEAVPSPSYHRAGRCLLSFPFPVAAEPLSLAGAIHRPRSFSVQLLAHPASPCPSAHL